MYNITFKHHIQTSCANITCQHHVQHHIQTSSANITCEHNIQTSCAHITYRHHVHHHIKTSHQNILYNITFKHYIQTLCANITCQHNMQHHIWTSPHPNIMWQHHMPTAHLKIICEHLIQTSCVQHPMSTSYSKIMFYNYTLQLSGYVLGMWVVCEWYVNAMWVLCEWCVGWPNLLSSPAMEGHHPAVAALTLRQHHQHPHPLQQDLAAGYPVV